MKILPLLLILFSFSVYANKSSVFKKPTIAVDAILVSDTVTKDSIKKLDIERILLDLEQSVLSVHQFDLISRSQSNANLLKMAGFKKTEYKKTDLSPQPIKARYKLVPTITNFVFDRKFQKMANIANKYSYTDNTELAIDVEIHDALTGLVLTNIPLSVSMMGEPITVSEEVGGPERNQFNVLSQRTMTKLAPQLVDAIFPMVVLKVKGKRFWINRGHSSDLRAGGTLYVYAKGEALLDPYTGDVLGTSEAYIGKAKIEKINPKLTTMRWSKGTSMPVVGDIVRATKAK